MKLSSAKIGIACVAATIVVGIGLFFIPAKKPSLRLVLLSATNDVKTGTAWGVFRLENNTTKYMSPVSGQFQERKGLGWAKVAGAYDPRPGAKSPSSALLRPGGAWTFRTQVPSGVVSYRLVLEIGPCIDIRDVGKPLSARKDPAFKIGSFLLRHGLLSQRFQALLSNSRWVKTKPFRSQRSRGSI